MSNPTSTLQETIDALRNVIICLRAGRFKHEIRCAESLEDAHRRLADFEVDDEPFFSDTWEWDLTDYTFRFIWCCYAIVWGIQQYDASKAAASEVLA